MLTRLGERRAKVQGVGVAFSGFVDFRQGLSLDAMHIAHANALPLQRYLANVLALPVIMDDSARAVALAEVRYGAARHSRNCICVSVGQGIGTGVIIDGQLYRGALGLAGELGHIPVSLGGTPCRCGGHGCLETLASGAAVLARARTLLEQGMPSRLHALCDQDYARLTPGLITEAALAGDEMALSLLRHVGQWLGLGLAILGNLYSPELLVLTGSVMRGNTLLLDMVRQEMQRYLLPPLRSSLKVVLTALDDAAGASGAATFILDDAFERGFAHRLGAVHPPAPVLES
jgi:predicted NBD/HSP70 family sugar kinase